MSDMKKQKLVVVEATTSIDELELMSSDSFSAVGCASSLDSGVMTKFSDVLKTLKSKAMKFNYNNDGRDELTKQIFKEYEVFSEVFLPFKNFNKENLISSIDEEEILATVAEPSLKAHKIAAAYKYKKDRDDEGAIKYNSLNETIKKFSGRDVHLLLGSKCAMKVKFLVIYTNDKAEADSEIDFKTTGSASFPIKLANVLNIPVFNLNRPGRIDDLVEFVNKL